MEIIHCKLPMEELVRWGNKIGELLKPDMDCGRYDHACSDMISIEMISELGFISDLCNHSYTEIINSTQLMTRWVNYSKIVKCMLTAVEHWLVMNGNIAFDDHYLKSTMEDYPRHIHQDISVFAAWAILNGADGASIRRNLPSKIQENTRKITKAIGVSGIITMLWRSLVAFMAITEKCILPVYKKSIKHGTREEVKFGQVSSAFAQLKKTV